MRHNNRRGHGNHRQNNNGNRSSGHHRSGGIRPNTVFNSVGPNGRVRGTAAQVYDKYLSAAQDAQTSGNKVKMEALYQHAEHYARLLNYMNEQREQARQRREEQQQSEDTPSAEESSDTAPQAANDEQPAPKKRRGRPPRKKVTEPTDTEASSPQPEEAVA